MRNIHTQAFNAFFTAPYFTLSVEDPTYFITFAIMAMTSVITSALTSKAKKMTMEAVRNEQEASALYHLTSHLTDAESVEGIARIAVQTISATMDCHAACLCFDEQGQPERTFIQQKTETEQVRRSSGFRKFQFISQLRCSRTESGYHGYQRLLS